MKSIFTLFALAGSALGAVSFNLPGDSESASWALSSTNHPGFNTFRTAANPWTSTVSPDAGSASAVLGKVSGSGYIGSEFLYTAAVTGVFSIQDTSPLANLAIVIFHGRISDPPRLRGSELQRRKPSARGRFLTRRRWQSLSRTRLAVGSIRRSRNHFL